MSATTYLRWVFRELARLSRRTFRIEFTLTETASKTRFRRIVSRLPTGWELMFQEGWKERYTYVTRRSGRLGIHYLGQGNMTSEWQPVSSKQVADLIPTCWKYNTNIETHQNICLTRNVRDSMKGTEACLSAVHEYVNAAPDVSLIIHIEIDEQTRTGFLRKLARDLPLEWSLSLSDSEYRTENDWPGAQLEIAKRENAFAFRHWWSGRGGCFDLPTLSECTSATLTRILDFLIRCRTFNSDLRNYERTLKVNHFQPGSERHSTVNGIPEWILNLPRIETKSLFVEKRKPRK